MRAGAHALSLLAVPLNVHVLQALTEEPRTLTDLRGAVGSPPQTTIRGQLRALTEAGIVERRRAPEFPGSVDYELGKPGRELLGVAAVSRAWLLESPQGPIQLGSVGAKGTIKALVEGWSSTILRILAAKPLSLTELNRLIPSLNYPSLERRLGALRLAGMIEPCPGSGRGTPYAVTPWLRRAIGPLAAAARWERQHLPEQTAAIRRTDIDAAFLLAVPLVNLPAERSGTCRLVAEMRNGDGEQRLAGVRVTVEEGRVASCVSKLEGDANAWASGSAADWLRAVIDADRGKLELGGDCELALNLVEGLNDVLFPARQAA